jgi:hypothetical protein
VTERREADVFLKILNLPLKFYVNLKMYFYYCFKIIENISAVHSAHCAGKTGDELFAAFFEP